MCSPILQNVEKNCWATFIFNFVTQSVQVYFKEKKHYEKKWKKSKDLKIKLKISQ